MRRPVFVRSLSAEERAMLEELRQTFNPLEQTRMRIVLQSNEGLTAAQIAQQVGWTPRAIRRVIQRYNKDGISSLSDRRRTNPGRRPIVTDEWQEQLLAMIEQAPATYGTPASRWTARLLVASLAQNKQIPVSEERVRHYLRRNGYRYTGRHWCKVAVPVALAIVESGDDSEADGELTRSAEEYRHQTLDGDVSV